MHPTWSKILQRPLFQNHLCEENKFFVSKIIKNSKLHNHRTFDLPEASRAGIKAVAADSTQLSTVAPSHKPSEGTNCDKVREHPTHETEVEELELPRTGFVVTTLSAGVSDDSEKSTEVSWILAKSWRAKMPGADAEQE